MTILELLTDKLHQKQAKQPLCALFQMRLDSTFQMTVLQNTAVHVLPV